MTPRAATARPAGLSREAARVALAAILAVALALQLGLLAAGFYRITPDESARSLMAHGLTWGNALEPWIWPPFYRIFVGLALKLHDDVFLVPRLLVSLAGILLLPALAWLAGLLLARPGVTLLTALIAVVLPPRLVLSVVPMADVFHLLLLVVAAGLLLRWLRTGQGRPLLLAALCLMLAATVRYEAWLVAATLIAYLAHRVLISRDLAPGTAALATLLLALFPAFWIADSWLTYGSLDNLGVTRWQFLTGFGEDHARALYGNVATSLLRDLLWAPVLLLGVAGLVGRARADRQVRDWAIVLFLPLPLLGALMLATWSVPGSADARLAGGWSLLLLPFAAETLLRCAGRLRQGRPRRAALTALLALALAPPLVRDARILHRGMLSHETGAWRQERAAGLLLRDELARLGPGKALIDATDNLDYLDVLTGSTVPDRFVLTSLAEPVDAALYLPMRDAFLARDDRAIIAAYLTDRFALDHGGSAEALARADVRLVAAHGVRLLPALDASPLLERVRALGDWTVYRVRPGALGPGDRGTGAG